MNVTISSKMEQDYLLINASGSIFDIGEYKLLQERYYTEIVKYDVKTIIVNESEMELPMSLMAQSEIVKFFSDELPDEIKGWTIAAVLPGSYMQIAKFWELQANNNGYFNFKVFSSVAEAQRYISI